MRRPWLLQLAPTASPTCPARRTTPCPGCEGCGRAHFRSRGSRADPSTPHEGLASLDPAVVFQSCSKLVATLAEAGQGALAGQTSGGQRTAWEHLGFWSQGQILLVAGPLPRPAPLPRRPLQHRVECIQLCIYFPLLEVSSFPHHGFPSTPWRGRGP